eukprot:Skav227332  [mRNA]  locus=scaffold4115:12504:17127:- [translate_table: standard]
MNTLRRKEPESLLRFTILGRKDTSELRGGFDTMAMKWLLAAFLALVADAASPVGKVVSLLESMKGEILDEGKAEEKKITEYSNMCEKRTADLQYQIKTAKTDIDELSARISKAESKAEVTATVERAMSVLEKEMPEIEDGINGGWLRLV